MSEHQDLPDLIQTVLRQMEKPIQEVAAERVEQVLKFGIQDLPDGLGYVLDNDGEQDLTIRHFGRTTEMLGREILDMEPSWAGVFLEEVGEAMAARDVPHLREELIQVAAVALAWVAHIDGRSK